MDSRRIHTTCPSMLSDAAFPTTSPSQLKLRFCITCLFACFSFLFPFFFTNSFLNYASDAALLGMKLKHDLKVATEQKAFFGLVTHSHVLSDILIKLHLKLLIFVIKIHLIIGTTCKLSRVENVF